MFCLIKNLASNIMIISCLFFISFQSTSFLHSKNLTTKLSLKLNSHLLVFIYFRVSPLKMMKNAFYFMLKALLALEIFTFLSSLFAYVEKWFDKKAMVHFKIYDITDWTTNNYNTYIEQYLNK